MTAVITSSRQVLVKTVTIREGRKVVEKRVVLAMRDDPTVVVMSLPVAEAKSLGWRMQAEGIAIEGGQR